MRTRRGICSAVITLALVGASATAATGTTTSIAQVRAVYRSVLTAEYFGPAQGVCSHLTAAGVRSFTAGGTATCTKTFQQGQHDLTHKIKGIDDSGFTPAQWRKEVAFVMGELKVTVNGTHATAIGADSGIPGKTILAKIGGTWFFTSYPPSISS